MRVIGYVRASTDDQQTTLKDQAERIRAYVKAYGHELVDVVIRNESAKDFKHRDGFREVQERLFDGEAEILCVNKLDRYARDVESGLRIADQLHKRGIRLMSVEDSIADSTSPNGRLMFTFLLMVAEWERRIIADRTSKALQWMKNNGKRVSHVSRVPYGQKPHPTDEALTIPCHDELAVIETMKAWRADGWSYRAIADELEFRGIKTKTGKTRWNHSTVSRIIRASEAVKKSA